MHCISIYTSTETKHTHLYTGLTRNTFMNIYNSTVDVFKLSILTVLYFVHGKFQKIIHFRLADPVPPPLDPGCQFDMMCIHVCEKHIYCRKDMLGLGGGGTYLEINYKIVN